MIFDAKRALVAYAGITTAALTWFLVTAASPAPPRQAEIDVERINVREPDGTLRMVISNAAREPGIVVKGTSYPHPSRRAAGLLFYNEEGTENGGLIFGGKERGGKAASYGSLTFDRYEQDQLVQLIGDEDDGKVRAGIAVSDRPTERMDYPAIVRAGQLPAGQRAAAYAAAHVGGQSRAFLGREQDRSSQLALRDGQGRKRLVLRVTEEGAAAIDFLGADGKVVRTVTPAGG